MHYIKQHEMQLARIHASGAEEWFCPTCARRFLIQWPPDYKKIILEPGDEQACHSGGRASLLVQPEPEDEPILSEELKAALDEVLKDLDFGDDFDEA